MQEHVRTCAAHEVGLKASRVTGKTIEPPDKAPYDPSLAADVLSQNAQNGGQTLQPGGQGGQSTVPPIGQTGSPQVTLGQPWAQPTQPLPLTPENDPEGEPIGTLQGSLEDMQGRFNLNNLGRVGSDGKPTRVGYRFEVVETEAAGAVSGHEADQHILFQHELAFSVPAAQGFKGFGDPLGIIEVP